MWSSGQTEYYDLSKSCSKCITDRTSVVRREEKLKCPLFEPRQALLSNNNLINDGVRVRQMSEGTQK